MLPVLYYDGLDTKGRQEKVEKVVNALAQGDFKTADVKKLQGTQGLYRAKLDRSERLLFSMGRYKGQTYILLLELIEHHRYQDSKFLKGAEIDENRMPPLPAPEQTPEMELTALQYVNPRRKEFHLLDKIVSFDEDQEEVFALPAPLIIIGSAGSGKTALTLEKMKHLHGRVAYVSRSPYLVENAERIYFSHGFVNEQQEVEFISFDEYLRTIRVPKGQPLSYHDFETLYQRYRQKYKFREPYKLYEEIRGVLTGSDIHSPYLSREAYRSLGVKQSIFLGEERERVYDFFEEVLRFMEKQERYEPNILAFHYLAEVEARYDFVVVDEVQDITNVQLLLILKALRQPTQFVLSGDANQIVHPNFFSWSKIKSLFFEDALKSSAIRILKTNYRNSRVITQLSNNLLKIKNARFGSIDKESTYLIDTVSGVEGELHFLPDRAEDKKQLNERTRRSARFAVLVMRKEDKAEVKKTFDTPLVFSVPEAKGLEYDNIILVNFVSEHEGAFREIVRDIGPEALEAEALTYGRAKDKENKELEAYKFYINSLYVAFTRAVRNLYLIESKRKHPLLELLGITQQKSAEEAVETQTSTNDEWLEEARRLEQQGKTEQAQEIRDRLRGVAHLSQEQVEALKAEVLEAGEPSKASIQQLFQYARDHFQPELVAAIADKTKYGPARDYLKDYRRDQKVLPKHCRNGNLAMLAKLTGRYGIDMRGGDYQMTGLMLATYYGKEKAVEYFFEHEANPRLLDARHRNLLEILLLGFDHNNVDEKRLARLYPRMAPPHLKVVSQGGLRKLSFQSMEYFLVHYLQTFKPELVSPDDPPAQQGLSMDEFMEFIELMPDPVLPPYRRKRQYVNSILAKNEIDRDDPYNRKLFRRRSRGVYDLDDDLQILRD
jgi:SAM-dependent methyltransferase